MAGFVEEGTWIRSSAQHEEMERSCDEEIYAAKKGDTIHIDPIACTCGLGFNYGVQWTKVTKTPLGNLEILWNKKILSKNIGKINVKLSKRGRQWELVWSCAPFGLFKRKYLYSNNIIIQFKK